MPQSRKTRLIGGAVTLLVLGVVGLVYAAWTATGTGSGYAQAGTAQALSTVDVSASTTADLYPTKNGTLTIQIHNPNTYAVTVDTITGTGPGVTTPADPACVVTGVTANNAALTGLSIAVPAGGNSTIQNITNGASMSNASETGCQGKKFTIPVTVSGTSGP